MSEENNNQKKKKTIPDIIAHLRDWADRMPDDPDDNFWFERPCDQMQEILRGLADDIEGAWKHEVSEESSHTCPTAPLSLDEAISHAESCVDATPCGQNHKQLAEWLKELRKLKSGNAAAMREALKFIKPYFDKIDPYNPNTYTFSQIEVEHISKTIKAALASPPRNCDLQECSTIEGMIDKHEEFCQSYHDNGGTCAKCPHDPPTKLATCREAWLIAKATEEGGKE